MREFSLGGSLKRMCVRVILKVLHKSNLRSGGHGPLYGGDEGPLERDLSLVTNCDYIRRLVLNEKRYAGAMYSAYW